MDIYFGMFRGRNTLLFKRIFCKSHTKKDVHVKGG